MLFLKNSIVRESPIETDWESAILLRPKEFKSRGGSAAHKKLDMVGCRA